jgi:aminoglycoside phosphotransferase (APT) family kinase protein
MLKNEIADRFKAYVSHKIRDAQNIEIGTVNKIFGGASRETFSIGLNYKLKAEEVSQRVILRREFEDGIIETDTTTEFNAYKAFYDTDVPVPKVMWLEKDTKWLDTPFFVMEEIMDCEDAHRLFTEPPYNAVREKAGESFCRIMAAIATTDPENVGLHDKLDVPMPDECWKRELDYWEADSLKNEQEPQPLLRAAIRRLRRNPPPPAQKIAVVHGDMRAGNFLFNQAGEIKAILDWEMMHAGDPLEDLAWSLNILWSWAEPDRLGLMITRERAIRTWEERSGFKADPKALYWWELFTSVKAMAIWISMARIYATGSNTDPIIPYGGLWAGDHQRRILLRQMEEKHETGL